MGMAFPAIAKDLSISHETAVTYRKRGFKRMGMQSRQEMLIWFLGTFQAPTIGPF